MDFRRFPTFLLVAAIATSCTVTENISFSGTGGKSEADIDTEGIFIDVLNDFSEFLPEDNGDIMDGAISSFSAQIEDTENASGTVFIKDGDHDYYGTFDFASIEGLLTELSDGREQSIIKKEDKRLSFKVDINNYSELERVVPFLKDPNIEVFLAKYNIGYSEDDYYDMVTFSLGEDAPDAIKRSVITINGTVPGTITETVGAKKTGSNTFSYSFPLISFLLLSEPLSFTVSWQ